MLHILATLILYSLMAAHHPERVDERYTFTASIERQIPMSYNRACLFEVKMNFTNLTTDTLSLYYITCTQSPFTVDNKLIRYADIVCNVSYPAIAKIAPKDSLVWPMQWQAPAIGNDISFMMGIELILAEGKAGIYRPEDGDEHKQVKQKGKHEIIWSNLLTLKPRP